MFISLVSSVDRSVLLGALVFFATLGRWIHGSGVDPDGRIG